MERLLLHTCCAVCTCYVLDKLRHDFQVTAYFYNPNIQPREEYERRRDTVKEWCEKSGVPFVEGLAGYNEWSEAVIGLEHEREGGKRCPICFEMRLKETARYAHEHNFVWLATTLTMGRNKSGKVINPIGKKVAEDVGVKFYEADWKKAGGQDKANEIAIEHNLYRQHYCGCVFSHRACLARG